MPPEVTYAVVPYAVEIRGLPELTDVESTYWTEVDLQVGPWRIRTVTRLRTPSTDENGVDVYEVPLLGRSAELGGAMGNGLVFTNASIPFKRSILVNTYRKTFLQVPVGGTTMELEPQDGETFTRVTGQRMAYQRRVLIKRLGRMEVTLVYLVTKEQTPSSVDGAEFAVEMKRREAQSRDLVKLMEGRYAKSSERRAKSFKDTLDALAEEKREQQKKKR
jgi:hypothetical protein